MLHFIDSNYNPRNLNGSRKRGSGPLRRELESLRCNTLHVPLPHLPINFYNPELGEERIGTMVPLPPIDFPVLEVSAVSFLLNNSTHHIL